MSSFCFSHLLTKRQKCANVRLKFLNNKKRGATMPMTERPLCARDPEDEMFRSFRIKFAETLENFLTDPENDRFYTRISSTFPGRIRDGFALPEDTWIDDILCRVGQDLRF